MRTFEDRALRFLVVAVSLAFGWVLWPFYGAILWGIVGAIVFAPLYRRLSQMMRERRSLAAIVTIVLIVIIVILPLTLIGASLAQEASGAYGRVQSGELDITRLFQQMLDALPSGVINLLDRFGLGSLAGMQDKLSAGLLKGSQFLAAQALNIGQSTFDFFVNLLPCFICSSSCFGMKMHCQSASKAPFLCALSN